MTLLVPNNGEGDALQYFVNRAAPENLILRLWKTPDISPSETDTAATYTEANWTGYAAKTLTGATWGAPTEGAPTSIAYALQSFISTAGAQSQTNYGYYMTRATSGRIALAERFSDGPYTIVNLNDEIKVTPIIEAA